jgi:hypothetical protein
MVLVPGTVFRHRDPGIAGRGGPFHTWRASLYYCLLVLFQSRDATQRIIGDPQAAGMKDQHRDPARSQSVVLRDGRKPGSLPSPRAVRRWQATGQALRRPTHGRSYID